MSRNDPRVSAAKIVDDVLSVGKHFGEVMEAELSSAKMKKKDRALLYEIAAGTLRRMNSIDRLVSLSSDRSIAEIDSRVLACLRTGIYQLVYLSKVPDHAVLSETVNAVGTFNKKAGGFVNAVLRSVQGLIDCKLLTVTPFGRENRLLRTGYGWCRFKDDVLPEKERDFLGFFEIGLSYPRELAEVFVNAFGMARAFQLGEILNERAPLYLRINTLKTTRDSLYSLFKRKKIKARRGGNDRSIEVLDSVNVSELPGFSEGLFTVQDETAQAVSTEIDVPGGGDILDICAAPGGKTTHLAEDHPDSIVTAVDVNPSRLALVANATGRLGLENVSFHKADARKLEGVLKKRFPVVLVDAPCTNTGVYRRRPDARWRFNREMVKSLVQLQGEILEAASGVVEDGGSLVYSTCSILPEENTRRVEAFIKHNSLYHVEMEKTTYPVSSGPDGGYVAILRKSR